MITEKEADGILNVVWNLEVRGKGIMGGFMPDSEWPKKVKEVLKEKGLMEQSALEKARKLRKENINESYTPSEVYYEPMEEMANCYELYIKEAEDK